ncbi:hypothetical protein RHMOL_Rhmol03G0226000 [Rhododendron molle]|uniref:Uncharacterized protein n=1 Tax=Rhododendron molle TaxID=49168 RepID=A0ACC0PIN0_RHOML|nr:hypothetical protein RHMOL_Rhmol03G0226000 [Rhododendron molle]
MFIYIFLFFLLGLSTAQDDCTPKTCSDLGPPIRFPFRINNHHPPQGGCPGFDLSCSPNDTATVLNLPNSVKVVVTHIDYKSRLIHIKDPNSCFPQQLQNLNLSTTPFQFADLAYNFSLFSCPLAKPGFLYRATCLGGDGREVYAEKGATLGSFFLLVILIAMNWFYRQKKIKRKDHQKIERFLADYRALKPARYSYADIKKITNRFKDKVGQGGYGIVYRGQLSNDVYVAVKILNSTKENGEEFINEVGIIGTIHHVNVVRLVGYCADGFRRALIYEFLPNDSLEKFASSDHRKRSLGWKKLLEIAMGIAKGIEYLHQGCDQQILHFDIKPHNILLDENLNPKITDFGLAKLCSKEQSVVSMTTARGTIGYIAPEVFSRNFGKVSYKSDIYSFGMLLLEMVGGKKNFDAMVNSTNQIYFPEWIYNRLESGEELGIHIQDEGDAKIAKKLAIIGLWCIQWYPVDRPSMHGVIQMLEGDGDTLIKPPNPFASTNPALATGQASGRPFNSELEVIVESE